MDNNQPIPGTVAHPGPVVTLFKPTPGVIDITRPHWLRGALLSAEERNKIPGCWELDCRKVRLYAVDNERGCIIGAVYVTEDRSWIDRAWPLDGKHGVGETWDDLVPEPAEPQRYQGWVNVYRNEAGIPADGGDGKYIFSFHGSRSSADKSADFSTAIEPRFACVEVQFEFHEGQGLQGSRG